MRNSLKDFPSKQQVFNSIYGALFFGVPNHGMKVNSLIPMVEKQINQSLLHSISDMSQQLRDQNRDFQVAFDFPDQERHESRLECFYELRTSATAIMVGPTSLRH
jgi:hypothetical protein